MDGGQDKCLVVIQMHDLDNPDPTIFKDGGRRRSIIVARGLINIIIVNFTDRWSQGDYCAETRDNLELILGKLIASS